MDRKELARKLREALFDHIEAGRREALQDGAIDRLFERVLSTHEAPQPAMKRDSLEALLSGWSFVDPSGYLVGTAFQGPSPGGKIVLGESRYFASPT